MLYSNLEQMESLIGLENFLLGKGKPTIALANSELQSNQNDTVILTPENHSLSASLTISANCTNWIGAAHGKNECSFKNRNVNCFYSYDNSQWLW